MSKREFFSTIIATGSYLPKKIVKNEDFLDHQFYESDGKVLEKSNREIIDKFEEITTISERRYVTDDLVTSDIAYFAALEALTSASIDPETLDYIIVAQNFGDIKDGSNFSDFLPTLAARVKQKLKIENPDCVAYDLPFGCPGWVQAMIQADYYIKSGDAKRIMVIGADVLSRICDPHDRDSLIYADGAAAAILEAVESDKPIGILGHKTRSDTLLHAKMLYMGASYNAQAQEKGEVYLKMQGRKLYQYALENVPVTIKACLEKCDVSITQVNKVLIHQANGKMDDAILKRLFQLCGIHTVPKNLMPMTINWLGNSSVATIPTLLDLILKGNMEDQSIKKGDVLVFASVGAGMNINAFIYKV